MLLVICCPERDITKCRRSRKCSKEEGHSGKCDSKLQINPFWKTSPVYNIHKQRQSLQEGFDRQQVKEDDLSKKEQDVLALQSKTEEFLKRSGMRCVLVTSIYLYDEVKKRKCEREISRVFLEHVFHSINMFGHVLISSNPVNLMFVFRNCNTRVKA